MKTIRNLTCLLLVALLLTACGQTTPATPGKDHQQLIIDASRSWFQYDIPPVEVSHGEDYVIDWEDAGMEAHIRFLLDKPDGDILHSDVWDVQVLVFDPQNGMPHDVMLKEPVEGFETFYWETIIYKQYMEQSWSVYDSEKFPEVKSLADLRHFDSLQRLEVFGSMEDPIDPAGLEHCSRLKHLTVYHVENSLLSIAATLPELQYLAFLPENQPVDLTPLQGHPTLETLHLGGKDLVSLEPLATMPNLRALNLDGSTFPSLEPLTQTGLEALSIGLGEAKRGMYSDLDYEPLSRIKTLVHLDLVNHTAFDVDDCEKVLEGCTALKYLDISYTPAANAYADGNWEPDFTMLEAYLAKPD